MAARSNGTSFGEADYRRGGIERLGDALSLLDQRRFAGSIYLAGRGVESMLRALIWRFDPDVRTGRKSLATGHDLRELLAGVRDLGVLREQEKTDEIAAAVERIARLWFNNMRFASSKLVENHWRRLGAVQRRITFQRAAERFYADCSIIVKRTETLCQK